MAAAERTRSGPSYLRAFAAGLTARDRTTSAQIWPRQSGVLHKIAKYSGDGRGGDVRLLRGAVPTRSRSRSGRRPTAGGQFGLLVREPVGVVGAIVPWNAPIGLIANKVAPALIAGCTVVLKASPEAPGEAYVVAEVAESIGLPPGVLNVVTADREVSELLVRDPRVDKITFTGSTAAGRRIASLCGERIARCTLELGGKSAAVVLDDIDLGVAAKTLAKAECFLTGQVCSSLTRIIVSRSASRRARRGVGEPVRRGAGGRPLRSRDRRWDRSWPSASATGCSATSAKGVEEGATLVTGGGRPAHLERGWFVEPTVFANVDNSSTIAQEEIFGPVLSVIPADDEQDAVRLANDTIYGLNASVFTDDVDRARAVAGQLRSGTVGHNAFRTDFGIAFGGFKQSGIGREGGTEGSAAVPRDQDGHPRGHPVAYRGDRPQRVSSRSRTGPPSRGDVLRCRGGPPADPPGHPPAARTRPSRPRTGAANRGRPGRPGGRGTRPSRPRCGRPKSRVARR